MKLRKVFDVEKQRTTQVILSVSLKATAQVSDLDLFAIFRVIRFSCLQRRLKLLKQIEASGLINKPHPKGRNKLEPAPTSPQLAVDEGETLQNKLFFRPLICISKPSFVVM